MLKRNTLTRDIVSLTKYWQVLAKLTEIWSEYTESVDISQEFKPRWLCEKRKLKFFQFHIIRWTSFLIIPVLNLYDEYTGRQKLAEQKTLLGI